MPLTLPLIVPAIRLDQDAEAETRTALARARQPWVAGFILFGGEATQVAQLTAELRGVAERPIFIASDMERGAGQQVAGLTRLPDLGILGLAASPAEAEAFGELTAREAMRVGIDVVFGPCLDVRSELDNPILGNRSFGFDPQRVADLGRAYVSGVRAGGALPVAKHFPGHGATREDSHEALPVVHADLATLEARDLPPFRSALTWGGCPAVMAAHVAYPALDPSGAIATFSAPILARARAMAAEHPEHSGVLVFTDALMMAGATVPGGEPEAAARALAAGCDMLLYPDDPEAVAAALEDDADARRAAAARDLFLARGSEARAWLDDPNGCGDPDPELPEVPERVAARAVALAGGLVPFPSLVVLVDDDGIEERGDVLAAALQGRGVALARLRVGEHAGLEAPPAWGPEEGAERGLPSAAIVVFAQARAWKGASGVSEAGRRLARAVVDTLVDAGWFADVIWCAPRPGAACGTHIPGNGPQVERALAARLLGDVDPLAHP